MLMERLQRFLGEFAAGSVRAEADDPRVAAAALLAHVARAADGRVDRAECEQMIASLMEEFAVKRGEAETIATQGKAADEEAVDLFRFTSTLKAEWEIEQRIAFVNLIWDMVFVDGQVHELEDNLVWRIAELLGVSSRDRMIGKREAAERSQAVAAHPS